MELQQLRYFRAVATEQSFTRAAKRLFVTQPNVSIQIRKLEHELGVSLFDRLHSGVTLSAAGEVLDDCAASVLSTVDDTVGRLRTLGHESTPPLRVAYLPSLDSTIVPSIVVALKQAAPDVPLSIEEIADSDRIQSLLADGDIDVGLARIPNPASADASRVLFTEEFVIAYPDHGPLSAVRSGEPADLATVPFVLPSGSGGLRRQILDICRAIGFEPRVALEAQSLDLLLGAVVKGVGVSVLPRLCLCKASAIVPVPLQTLFATRTISLAWRQHAEPFLRYPELTRCLQRSELPCPTAGHSLAAHTDGLSPTHA